MIDLGVFRGNTLESNDTAVRDNAVQGSVNSMMRAQQEEIRASSGGGGGTTVSLQSRGDGSERGSPALNLGVFSDPTSRNVTEITGTHVEWINVHMLLHVWRMDACVYSVCDLYRPKYRRLLNICIE